MLETACSGAMMGTVMNIDLSLDGQQVSNYTFDYIAEMINGLAVVKKWYGLY